MTGATPATPATGAQNIPIFQDLDAWLANLSRPTVLIELASVAVCVALAWGVVAALRRALGVEGNSKPILFGANVFDGVLFPAVLLAFTYLADALLSSAMPVATFRVVIPAVTSLLAIRVGVKVLQVAFPRAVWVPPIERTISWVAWVATVLWVTGVLPRALSQLERFTWTMGGTTMSVRTLIEGIITAGAVLLFALWISSAIESRLLRAATGSGLSVRLALANATRALLLFVGLIIAMSAVGINLTALSVLGGAVGVGIGFGLQKLAANYVSGFVILAERSVRIGDNVRVDGFEGRITNITSRYTLIRAQNGRESIVPNEMLITQRVENLSLADPNVWQSTVVSVGYDSDVELVRRLLTDAAQASTRVLRNPAPSASLSAFGADGLEFTLGYWIADPESGILGLRSEINLAILAALRTHDIDIPYPQRVLHQASSAAAASSPSARSV